MSTITTAYDPATHREPEVGEMFRDEFVRGDRVCMIGTDLHGTVLESGVHGQKARVEWDYSTPEEGSRSWIDCHYLALVAVPR